MPRTEHNTVDDLFYPRSFGARNVVQDRSSRLRINLRRFHIHFFFVCAGLCNSTTKKRLGYANVYQGITRSSTSSRRVSHQDFRQRIPPTPNDDDDDSCHIYFDSPFDTVLLKVIKTRPFSTTNFYLSTNLPPRHSRRQMIKLMILILPHLRTITYHCNR